MIRALGLDLATVALLMAFVAGCFLGMVWVVETVRTRFWRMAILASGRCAYSGCVCPCHGVIEENVSARDLALEEGEFRRPGEEGTVH